MFIKPILKAVRHDLKNWPIKLCDSAACNTNASKKYFESLNLFKPRSLQKKPLSIEPYIRRVINPQ